MISRVTSGVSLRASVRRVLVEVK